MFAARFLQTSIAEAVLTGNPEEPTYGYLLSWEDKVVEEEEPKPDPDADAPGSGGEESEKLLESKFISACSDIYDVISINTSSCDD